MTADIETAVHYRYVGPLLATGRIPNSGEVAERLGVPVEDVRRALRSTTMFDVYLNDKRDLLVVRKGLSIPLGDTSAKWRKSKKRVVSVSKEIRQAIEKHGYYLRQLRNFRNNTR